jgi:hypothetical protein
MMILNDQTGMMKKLSISALILALVLIAGVISAQPGADITDQIRLRFESYCRSVPWEEIYVQTDRKEYIAGEEIWLNFILTDRQSSSVSSRSSIAYFELLNAENKPVVQKRFRLNSGIGPGQVLLPDSLSSGIYTMRVYTSWMKNFLPGNCYMEDISVYNPFNIKTFKRKVYDQAVAKEVALSRSDSAGSVKHLSISSVRLASGDHELNIFTDDTYRSENEGRLYLFIQTHGKIDRCTSEKVTGENTKITIPRASVTAGINQITVFDSKGKAVCEKLIWTPPADKNHDLKINSPDTFSIRSRISVGLELPASEKVSNITVSVTPVTNNSAETDLNDYMVFGSEYGLLPLKTTGNRKISDIPLEELDSLLSRLKSNWLSWDKILSDDKPVFRYEFEKEEHFIEGLLLAEGRQLGFPGEKIVMSVPGKVAQFQYAVTNDEANFTLPVPVEDNIQDLIFQPVDTARNYRIFIESSFSDKNYPSQIVIDSVAVPVISFVSKWSLNYQVEKIYGSENTGNILFPPSEPRPLKRFYGKPDFELIMNDFIKLPTMEEVFFELIPRVRFLKTGKKYEIAFLDFSGNKLYEEPPVMMIDGVIFNDASVIARIDPEVVEKIDITRGIYHIGGFAFQGIVNVITNAGNFIRLPLPEYALRTLYKITEPALAFVSPDYSEKEIMTSRNPDLRNTLYWNPAVKQGNDDKASVEFWSSDISSDYCITVLCISSDGQSFSARKVIKVR